MFYLINDKWYYIDNNRAIQMLLLRAQCVINNDGAVIKFRGKFDQAPTPPNKDDIPHLEKLRLDDDNTNPIIVYDPIVVYACAETMIVLYAPHCTYTQLLRAKERQFGPFPDRFLQHLAEDLIKINEQKSKLEVKYDNLMSKLLDNL